MRRRSILLGVAVLAAGLLVASLAGASGGKKNLKADELVGYQENPDVFTGATGSFTATLDDDAETITYELSYSGIEGGTVSAAHIHFGKRAVNGGVAAFLCSGADKPVCPATAGTVTGVIDVADIIGPTGQGINAGSYDELAAAMRAGQTYVNVHSTGATPAWPGGEIRAQINDRANND
jgi:CHRD domain